MVDRDRDRDARGKPLNARPRDELGRPLPRESAGVPRVPDDLELEPDESLTEAQRLLDHGKPFHAHEVLESTWKSAPAEERELWQGLAQLAVGFTHLLRDNPVGAVSLLRQGHDRIRHYEVEAPHAIDVAGLLAWSEHLMAEIERDVPLPDPPVPRLRMP